MEDLTPDQVAAVFSEITSRTDKFVRCQCDQHQCNGRAEVIAELHLIGACTGPEANEWGNRVELLCLACARHLWQEATMRAAQYRAAADRVGAHACCGSCQAPVSRPSDLLRSVKRIPGGVQ